jgi:release factor glutamine methyltransferase
VDERERALLVARLRRAGCVAPDEEADALIEAAASGRGSVDALARRRERGEPLAWVTGRTRFAGLDLAVHPGVYVPRPHTEALARRAAALVPTAGAVVDLSTGCGAIAATVQRAAPGARVLATDIDERAVACARANGVDTRRGDLDAPLPPALAGAVDVVVACPPYVPTGELALLPRDVRSYEPRAALAGGGDGLDVARRVVVAAARLLRPGGALLIEIGGAQAAPLAAALAARGFGGLAVGYDEDGDERFVEARFRPRGR